MAYKYSALDVSSRVVTGRIDVADEAEAEEVLSQQGYRLLTLKAFRTAQPLEQLMPTFFKVKTGQVIVFSKQLASLLEAGIDIIAAVEILQEQASSKPLKRLFADILKQLRAGNQLSRVLHQHRSIFPQTYLGMIEVGEKTGSIEGALRQASAFLEKQMEAVKKLSKALMYPSFVTGVAIVVVILLLVMVLPAISGIFKTMGADLPLPTKILMATSSFLRDNYLIIVILTVGVGVFVVVRFRSVKGRRQIDGLLLKVPVLGNLIKYSEIARFADTMSTLLQAGVTVSSSADMGASSCKNKVIKEAVTKATYQLLQGHGLSGPLSKTKLFPSMLIQMVRVGEETGSLSSTLAVVANFYETEVNERTEALFAMLEPSLTIAIAGIVGFIAISVIMPIYSILGSIQ